MGYDTGSIHDLLIGLNLSISGVNLSVVNALSSIKNFSFNIGANNLKKGQDYSFEFSGFVNREFYLTK